MRSFCRRRWESRNWTNKNHMSSLKNFINFFRNKDHFKLTQVPDQIPRYLDGYDQAFRFTKSLGFETQLLALSDVEKDLLDPDGEFLAPVFRAAGISDPKQAAGQCLKWCHYLRPHFERQLGRKVILTTGQLWKGQTCVFGPTFDDVRRWTKSGLQIEDFGEGGGFKLHAWLTLESGEIIEPTYLSSMAAFGNDSYKEFAGATVWGRDPNVLNTVRYVPLTLGSEIIEHIAGLSVVPLLANGPHELGPDLAILAR